jgi:hypothetical protein
MSASTAGYHAAANQMIAHFDTVLTDFEAPQSAMIPSPPGHLATRCWP